jgi:hypothetical protein
VACTPHEAVIDLPMTFACDLNAIGACQAGFRTLLFNGWSVVPVVTAKPGCRGLIFQLLLVAWSAVVLVGAVNWPPALAGLLLTFRGESASKPLSLRPKIFPSKLLPLADLLPSPAMVIAMSRVNTDQGS